MTKILISTKLTNPIRQTRVLKLVFITIPCLKFWAQGRFMDNRIFKNLPPSKLYFGFFFKSTKFVIKSAKFFVCFCLTMWCLFVSNKCQNGWPDWSKFWVQHHMTPGKVHGWTNFRKFICNKIRFLKILKIHDFFRIKSAIFFVCFF